MELQKLDPGPKSGKKLVACSLVMCKGIHEVSHSVKLLGNL